VGRQSSAIKLGLGDMPPLRLALARFALSALVIFGYAMLTGRYQSLIGSAGFLVLSLGTEAGRPTLWTRGLVMSIVFQGAIIGGFNFLLNAKLLQIYRPSGLAIVSLTTPIWGVLVAAGLGGERLGPELVLSTLLVVAGIALTARP
jgi:drug/metabolite transporter (DMT)-like permease